MSVSTAVPRTINEAASPFAGDAAPPSAGAATSPGTKAVGVFVAMMLVLGSFALIGYTQWWVPREQAQQRAQVEYGHCLQDVKVYKGKKSYKSRLAQCDRFVEK
jgi:hypothetical protein